jgi:hypothetical protein
VLCALSNGRELSEEAEQIPSFAGMGSCVPTEIRHHPAPEATSPVPTQA